jgi:transposase
VFKEEAMVAEARVDECTAERVLFVVMELSAKKWRLGFTTGLGQQLRNRSIDAGDLEALWDEIARAKERFDLSESASVVSCYEAGRDGFWIDRAMSERGIRNLVVDPGSVQRNRRKRERKTDRLDVRKLMRCLIHWYRGDTRVWAVVQPPTVDAEDARHFHRELEELKKERTRHVVRIKGLLSLHGIRVDKIGFDFLDCLDEVRLWDGSKLPPQVKARLVREHERYVLVREQILSLERQRRAAIQRLKDPSMDQVRHLMRLKGIGENGAWLLVMELFGWREFRNRRQVGSIAGLTPTPWASGEEDKEQGIDKAGNRRVRAMMIELAWCWLRYQPRSELARWFERRFGCGGKRARRIGIVALARRLLVALWRYLADGVVPKGAVLMTPR